MQHQNNAKMQRELQKPIFENNVWIVFTFRNKIMVGRTIITQEGDESVICVSEEGRLFLIKFHLCENPNIINLSNYENEFRQKLSQENNISTISQEGMFDTIFFN